VLRTIATSVAQAVAIVLGAEFCWSLVAYFVEYHSFDLGPLLLLMLYPLPIAVAALRKHNALLSIIVTNLWLGWTVIGWFVVLIWACNWDEEPAAE
jgi:Superinfection immunity protein